MSAINGINSGATASDQPGNEWIIVEEDIFRGSPPLPDLRQPAPSLIKRVH